MNEVDPLTGQVNKSGEVGVCRKPLRLEPAIWLGEAALP